MNRLLKFLNFNSGFSYLETIVSIFVIFLLSFYGICYFKIFESDINKKVQTLCYESDKYKFEKRLESTLRKINFDYWENEKIFVNKLNEINGIVKYEILKSKKNQIFAVKFFYFIKGELCERTIFLRNFNLGKIK